MKRSYNKETIERKIPDNSADGFHWETVEIDVATAGTTDSSFSGEIWEVCQLCNHTDRRSNMGEIDGLWYCYKYDCYQDKVQELFKQEGKL